MRLNLDSSIVRDINTRKVLSAVRMKTSTRADLARMTNLSYPTVGTIVKELAKEGFVVDEGLGEYGGGRKPMLVRFEPTARLIIGVNLGGADPEAVVSDLNGEFVSPIVTRSLRDLEEDVVGTVIHLIEELQRTHQFSWERIIGIGICVRGSFDIPKGYYYYPGRVQPIRLQGPLEERFGVPVLLERNSSAAALWEWMHRHALGVNINDIVFINVDKGISSGMVVGGQLVRGFLGNAGEFGHLAVERTGEVCEDCGQVGCLESVASLGSILNEGRRKGLELPEHRGVTDNYRALVGMARSGDVMAVECFTRVTEALGASIRSLVNVINPELVVIGGRVVWQYPELLDGVSERVLAECWPYSRQGLRFALAREDKHNFLHGAIALILDRLFVSIGDESLLDWSSHREFMRSINN